MRNRGAHFLSQDQKSLLEKYVVKGGKLNIDQVGKSPFEIAAGAGFAVDPKSTALVAEVTETGRQEPLSMETLSPILTFYTEDGWEAGCERCIAILNYGGIGHALAIHCTARHGIDAFALEKPAMRIVVNTVAALGSVGYTTALFPAMTLGPGAVGGSITSDNVSPLHLINVKRVAFETRPVTAADSSSRQTGREVSEPPKKWITEIENRLRARAGNPGLIRDPRGGRPPASESGVSLSNAARNEEPKAAGDPDRTAPGYALDEHRIEELIGKFRR